MLGRKHDAQAMLGESNQSFTDVVESLQIRVLLIHYDRVDDGSEQIGFGRVVAVQCRFGPAGAIDDCVDGRIAVAVRQKQLRGRCKNLGLALFAAL